MSLTSRDLTLLGHSVGQLIAGPAFHRLFRPWEHILVRDSFVALFRGFVSALAAGIEDPVVSIRVRERSKVQDRSKRFLKNLGFAVHCTDVRCVLRLADKHSIGMTYCVSQHVTHCWLHPPQALLVYCVCSSCIAEGFISHPVQNSVVWPPHIEC